MVVAPYNMQVRLLRRTLQAAGLDSMTISGAGQQGCRPEELSCQRFTNPSCISSPRVTLAQARGMVPVRPSAY